MAKATGLGQFLIFGGYDLSNDIASVDTVHGGSAMLPATGIDKSAMERMPGLLDGGIDFTPFFNPTAAKAHPVFSVLPTTDVQMIYGTSTTLGQPAACLVGKQIDYAGTRGADGSMTFSVSNPMNGSALEWCNLLTAGKRTDTTATNGSSIDGAAASTTGWAAYVQCTAFTGTSVTLTIEDSANDSTFAAVTVGAFTAISSAPGSQRIAGAAGATLRRYVRVVSSGTFSSATFVVTVTRHPTGAAA